MGWGRRFILLPWLGFPSGCIGGRILSGLVLFLVLDFCPCRGHQVASSRPSRGANVLIPAVTASRPFAELTDGCCVISTTTYRPPTTPVVFSTNAFRRIIHPCLICHGRPGKPSGMPKYWSQPSSAGLRALPNAASKGAATSSGMTSSKYSYVATTSAALVFAIPHSAG